MQQWKVMDSSYNFISRTPIISPTTLPPELIIRAASIDDIDPILALHREAFADKFGGAFGENRIARGVAALSATWQHQGGAPLRGMFVAEWRRQVVGTTMLRISTMEQDFIDGNTQLLFQRILGVWGATRSIFALSLLSHPVAPHEGFITDVAVLTPFRRQGVATTLLQHVEGQARLLQKHYVSLYVSSANLGARTLYSQLGFRQTHVRRSWLTRLIFGQREWVYMSKNLT